MPSLQIAALQDTTMEHSTKSI